MIWSCASFPSFLCGMHLFWLRILQESSSIALILRIDEPAHRWIPCNLRLQTEAITLAASFT